MVNGAEITRRGDDVGEDRLSSARNTPPSTPPGAKHKSSKVASQSDSHDAQDDLARGLSLFKKRHRLLVAMVLTGTYLLLLFTAALAYFYGALFRDSQRAQNLRVLAVDYDGGFIGQALHNAYTDVQGPEYLKLDFESPAKYPDPSQLRTAMCQHGYWAVLLTHSGASDRLLSAISSNRSNPYDPKDAITYMYHGVRYPVIADAYIVAQLSGLIAATSGAIYGVEAPQLLADADLRSESAVHALFNPIRASGVDLSPTNQGARVLLNTITMIAPALMQFFFVMALDHTSTAIGAYTRHTKARVYVSRLLGATLFTILSGLVVTAIIFAFRESWQLSGGQFLETWMCFWLYMNICYIVMDSLVGTVVPLRWVSFFIFAFVILNITSTLFPFELSPGFYRWGYALPGHNIWLLLIDIWTDGCISKKEVALPVLFAWWLVGHVTSGLAVAWKCNEGRKSKERSSSPLDCNEVKLDVDGK